MNKIISFQPVIKWSGSKRNLAKQIFHYLPNNFDRYYEPFVGGGSILYLIKSKKKIASDINQSLIKLWIMIQRNPKKLYNHYLLHWNLLNDNNNPEGYKVYYEVRNRFNKSGKPEDLFFLSRTCVNGLIRFNREGEFNNSFHLTRKGIKPTSIKKIIWDWSARIKDVEFYHNDYHWILDSVSKNDLVYLDPPYFNTNGRYYGKIDFDSFVDFLNTLNKKGVKYILSYDGHAGTRSYIVDLPKTLYRHHYFLKSGNSTFNKVIDKKNVKVLESIYLNY